MPQDAFTIKYIANELKDLFKGAKISKILQPSRDLLIFIIYTRNGNVKLEACLSAKHARLSLTNRVSPTTTPPMNFCMALRKHLQNAEILNVGQVDYERIIYFDLQCIGDFSCEQMRLYFEIMGKYSNAVLTKDGIIVSALKTAYLKNDAKRLLFCGAPYTLPEAQDKINPDNFDAIAEVIKDADAKELSDKIKGVSLVTACEIRSLPDFSAKSVYDYLNSEKGEPCVTFTGDIPDDFKVKSFTENKKLYPSVLSAQTAYYDCILEKEEFAAYKSKLLSALNSAIKKAEKRLAIIEDKLETCACREEVKLKGELITANIYAIKQGTAVFEAENYYDGGKKIKIYLDKTLTPSQNAQAYFKRYAKLKRTAQTVLLQKDDTQKSLSYFESVLSLINSADTADDLDEIKGELIEANIIKEDRQKNKREERSLFRKYKSGEFIIYAGKSNLQNERLLKVLSGEDIWLHTQKYHSAHVGIKTNGNAVPDEVLLVAAEICAYYSDGREGTKIPVDYTLRKYVKKPSKSNLGFCTYTDYITVLVNPAKHGELIYEADKQ